MIAYKFLREGRVGPFSGFAWPGPSVWVDAARNIDPCRRGIHACRVQDLPWWLADELWEIELGGPVTAEEHKVVAVAGRLRRRVEEWTLDCAREYGEQCAWRARDRAAQALTRAGRPEAAGALAACTTLDEVLTTTRQMAADVAAARLSLTVAADGAVRALLGPPATAAYIAAHAAGRIDGPAGYAAERAWQSQWLLKRLGLLEDKPKGVTDEPRL